MLFLFSFSIRLKQVILPPDAVSVFKTSHFTRQRTCKKQVTRSPPKVSYCQRARSDFLHNWHPDFLPSLEFVCSDVPVDYVVNLVEGHRAQGRADAHSFLAIADVCESTLLEQALRVLNHSRCC
jgi:hypothetical protein